MEMGSKTRSHRSGARDDASGTTAARGSTEMMVTAEPIDPEPTAAARQGTDQAIALMLEYADRTGASSDDGGRRYLWTDAFAVCNLLGLAAATGTSSHRELALRLVDRVHRTLGRHRADDARTGWLSGLPDEQAEQHPTRGGLRIGKPLPERGPGDRFDERLEWDRDGQYFHYLTRWMHALDQVARTTGELRYNLWARELAEIAHRAFLVQLPDGRHRLAWKLSIDLSRPLVPAQGQHDPLDGFVTFAQLRATALAMARHPEGPTLDAELASLAPMIAGDDWTTSDPLGLGGLLVDAHRMAQLAAQGVATAGALVPALLATAVDGLGAYVERGELRRPPAQRLAFRELGLAIGLSAVDRMAAAAPGAGAGAPRLIAALRAYLPLGAALIACWLDPAHRATAVWSEHRDINDVMLATSLAPAGFLTLRPLG
jgi:hypothetical protein